MKKYLVEIWYCGNEAPSHIIMEAKDQNDLYKRIDVLYYMGYDDVEEYEEEEGVPYITLNAKDCWDDIMSNEDVLMYIFDLTSQKEIYENDV